MVLLQLFQHFFCNQDLLQHIHQLQITIRFKINIISINPLTLGCIFKKSIALLLFLQYPTGLKGILTSPHQIDLQKNYNLKKFLHLWLFHHKLFFYLQALYQFLLQTKLLMPLCLLQLYQILIYLRLIFCVQAKGRIHKARIPYKK